MAIQTKDLNVNGKVVARYQIDGNDLWLLPMFVFLGKDINMDMVCHLKDMPVLWQYLGILLH